MSDSLMHIGTATSGRYPKGSGENPFQRSGGFMARYTELQRKGLTKKEIAEVLLADPSNPRYTGSVRDLNARVTIEKARDRQERVAAVIALKDKGWGPTAIAEHFGLSESSVRSYLDPEIQRRQEKVFEVSNVIKDRIAETGGFVDIGAGQANRMNISDEKLAASAAILKQEGYKEYTIPVRLSNGHEIEYKVLTPPGTTWTDVVKNKDKIHMVDAYLDNDSRAMVKMSDIPKPKSIDSSRVQIVYGDKGGEDRDGLIELRRGVEDVSLGDSRYSQVRIAVDDTHFIKGMAVYADDLPPGVDIRFNTNKPSGTPMKGKGDNSVLKSLKDDPDSPFKSAVRAPRMYKDKDGKEHQSVINKVNDEGDWSTWSSKFSSQMLSKQQPQLVKQQLDLTRARKQIELDEIMSLTNPVVRKKMLESFSDDCDSTASHLKAAGLPRTANHVILPVPSLKPNEVYAPGYDNGERVVLIRHPHAGIFEIPELVVNNKSRDARKFIPSESKDAIGIHPKVAKQLSGADFDGDSVLVIPNNKRQISTVKAQQDLINFDNRKYKLPDTAPKMSEKTKQLEMGIASNLITDMTIRGATQAEIFKAVKHSMVVIDAEKHHLDYKQSEKDHDIASLKKKYQDGGASTIISRAGAKPRIPERKPRPAKDGGPIDRETGERVYVLSGRKVKNKAGEIIDATERPRRLSYTDPYDLVSKERKPIEMYYAEHSASLKSMANKARKEYLNTPLPKKDPLAAKKYAAEVSKLRADLNAAKKLQPLERQAALIADSRIKAIRMANPNMDQDDLKKQRYKETVRARQQVGADRADIEISPRQWEAIQANAISAHLLSQIMQKANLDKVRDMAMPKSSTLMSPSNTSKAQAMLNAGWTRAEVAKSLGMSVSTLDRGLKGS